MRVRRPLVLWSLLATLSACTGADQQQHIAELEADLAAETALREQLAGQVQQLQVRLDRLEDIEARPSEISALSAEPKRQVIQAVEGGCDGRDAMDDRFRLPIDGDLAPEDILASLRAVPHRSRSGEIDGYRLSGIRRSSLLDSCGFKNGDIVHGVETLPLTSTEQAQAAWQELQDASLLRIQLTRRGEPLTLELRREAL